MNLIPILAGPRIRSTIARRRLVFGLRMSIGGLGAALAIVTVTRGFVGSIITSAAEQRRIIEHSGALNAITEEIPGTAGPTFDRRHESQQEFQVCVALMSDIQNIVLRDVIVTMRNIDEINGGSSSTIQGVQSSVGTLRRPFAR